MCWNGVWRCPYIYDACCILWAKVFLEKDGFKKKDKSLFFLLTFWNKEIEFFSYILERESKIKKKENYNSFKMSLTCFRKLNLVDRGIV